MSSTKLTKKSGPSLPMVESKTLKLAFALTRLQKNLADYLSRALIAKGHKAASPPVLNFLSELECGENHASEIARRLGVSRQMVSKTVADLAKLGLLQVAPDPALGNQKIITFSPNGERLMADARRVLADLDDALAGPAGGGRLEKLIQTLERVEGRLADQAETG